MCAIAGIFFAQNTKDLSSIEMMNDRMAYRGPDDSGVFFIEEMNGALAHRRLSILDLSPLASQPMVSKCQNYSLTYNGEIYNYQELKKELLQKNIQFKSHSDTEVLLQTLLFWGVEKGLEKINGMFAFAFVNHRQKKIYLARDRFGEKPLYYAWCNGSFLFASDLNGLRAYAGWTNLTISPQSVAAFLRYSYIPDPYTIYENVQKLRPGHYLEVTSFHVKETPYFQPQKIALQAASSPYRGSFKDAVEDIHADLIHSVTTRAIADVPLGCFLSGGIDSSLIAALLQSQSVSPLKTFTIGFEAAPYNEAPFAKKVAEFLGTDHHELYVTEKEARNVLPFLPSLYGEPFADPSQIPTFLVSKMAREKVKVCLSGDGGDELFGGYNRYIFAYKYLPLMKHIPRASFSLFKYLESRLNSSKRDCFYRGIFRKIPGFPDISFAAEKFSKLFRILAHSHSPAAVYRSLTSALTDEISVLTFLEQENSSNEQYREELSPPLAMMLADILCYLPGDILTKVDRASMGVSLEVRSPYLDPLLFAKGLSLPLSYKIKNNKGKAILRAILAKYIPETLIDRPKVGFGIPIGQWMKTSLREWCETFLAPTALKESGFFQEDKINEIWQDHLKGRKDNSSLLWNIIVFQQWLSSR